MKERIVIIHGQDLKKENLFVQFKRFENSEIYHISASDDLDVLKMMLLPETKKADKVIVIEVTSRTAQMLMETSETLDKVSIINNLGEYRPLKEERSQRHAKKIKQGLKKAKKNGKILGAPKGNSNKLNKIKDYDPKLVKSISRLLKAGKSYRQIVEEIPEISISKITYMKKRFEQEGHPLC